MSSPEPDDRHARPLRVLIADDDPMARAGIGMIISSASGISVVAEAEDGDQVVSLVQAHHPDVVIMDIRMPRMDGLAATAAVVALPSPPRVLVATTFDLDEYVFDALEAGASGFLLKGASPQEIITAVRTVAAGDAMLSPRSTKTLISHVVAQRKNPRRQRARAKLAELTEREREIVVAVAQGKANADIAAELFLGEATVKTHITRVFAKVEADNRVQLTIFAYEAGLVSP